MIKQLAILAILATLITILSGCTAEQKAALEKRGTAFLDRALDVAEARANKELDGFKK